MILSQIDIEPWHIYSSAGVFVCWQAAKIWTAVRKQKMEEKREDTQTKFYERIAVASEDSAKTTAAMHERLQHVCKANCPTK